MSKFILNVEKSSLKVGCFTQIREIQYYYGDSVTGIKGIPIQTVVIRTRKHAPIFE